MADTNDNVLRAALRGLRSNSIRAQRNRQDPKLLVSIGLAEPKHDADVDNEDEDEEDEDDAMPFMRRGR